MRSRSRCFVIIKQQLVLPKILCTIIEQSTSRLIDISFQKRLRRQLYNLSTLLHATRQQIYSLKLIQELTTKNWATSCACTTCTTQLEGECGFHAQLVKSLEMRLINSNKGDLIWFLWQLFFVPNFVGFYPLVVSRFLSALYNGKCKRALAYWEM